MKILLTLIPVLSFSLVAQGEEKVEFSPTAPLPETSEAYKSVEKSELENIYRYKDLYIISGKPDTKVQLSFKIRLIKDWELYLGYSQLMFWNLGTEDSSPFRDIAFNPELFYTHKVGDGLLRYVSAGIEHRSNGRAELQSRSFDRVFGQFENYFGIKDAKFNATLKVFTYYDLDRTNRDMQKYTGFWDLRLAASSLVDQWFPGKTEVYLSFFPGGTYSENILNGGRELGIKLRVRLFGLLPYLLLQAYHGHSESLLDYDEFTEAYRIGFLL